MLGVLGFAIFLSALLVHGCEAFPGYTQQNGRTRLLGSSFGVLGVNATFDYVVCPDSWCWAPLLTDP